MQVSNAQKMPQFVLLMNHNDICGRHTTVHCQILVDFRVIMKWKMTFLGDLIGDYRITILWLWVAIFGANSGYIQNSQSGITVSSHLW